MPISGTVIEAAPAGSRPILRLPEQKEELPGLPEEEETDG
jgi:hypothetical protein